MYRHVLVPVAFDEDHDPAAPLAVAGQLVIQAGKVSLLHVMANVPSYVINYVPEGFQREAQTAIVESLLSMAAGLPNSEGFVVEGHAGKTIVKWASDNAVDCIVIGPHKAGVQDFVLGSTAAQVVRHAKCAVHVTR